MAKQAWMHEDGEQFKIDDVYDLERRLSLAQGGGSTSARIRATRASFQFVSDDVDTKVEFDNKDWDIKDEFTNGTYTAKEEGYYLITSNAVLLTNKTVFLISISISVNDTFVNNQYTEGITLYDLSSIRTSDTIHLNIGDKVEIWVHQNSGTDCILIGVPCPTITTIAINKI